MGRSSRTIFVGNLPGDIRESEVKDLFYKYGPIVDVDLKIPPRPPGYAFVEFEDSHDAEDAIRGRDGYKFDGCRLRVELAHGRRGSSSHDRYSSGSSRAGASRRSDYRVLVTGLPSSASWQDLKDHMRRGGDVCFSQVYRDRDGMRGIADYTNYDDMKYAIRKLDDSLFRNQHSRAYIRVEEYDRRRNYSRSPSRSPYSRNRSVSRSPVYRDRSRSASPRMGGSGRSYSRSRSRSVVSESESGSPRRSVSKMGRSSRTIFVGNLPGDIRESEVKDLFYKYGPIVDVDLKIPPRPPGYAFVEFEDSHDAEDAIRGRDGYKFDGCRLRVELAHGRRGSSSHDRYSSGSSRAGASRRSDYRVLVTGLPSSASWQDLKDHMRRGGDVCFSQVYRDRDGMRGIADYTNYDDMKYAIRKLDDSLFRNQHSRAYIRVEEYDRRRNYSRSPSRSPYSRNRSVSRSPVYRDRSRSASPRMGGSGRSYSRSRSRSVVSESESGSPRRSVSKSPPRSRSASPQPLKSRDRSASKSRSPSGSRSRSGSVKSD